MRLRRAFQVPRSNENFFPRPASSKKLSKNGGKTRAGVSFDASNDVYGTTERDTRLGRSFRRIVRISIDIRELEVLRRLVSVSFLLGASLFRIRVARNAEEFWNALFLAVEHNAPSTRTDF